MGNWPGRTPVPLHGARIATGSMEASMDWDRLAGDWSQMGDKVRKYWGKLTEEDISQAGGRRDLLLERIRERYGLGPDEAEKQLQDWAASHDTQNSGQAVQDSGSERMV
jgi:uncharacterized protein YjbJ (UPF0337 family)